jgi:putative transposase
MAAASENGLRHETNSLSYTPNGSTDDPFQPHGPNPIHRVSDTPIGGYKRRLGSYGGRPSVVVDNTLDRQFDVAAPDKVWVSDITYIRTYEGFLYLAVVIDLYSRRVIGWATQSRQPTDLVLQALLMAVWRRKPKQPVLVHTDQGSQYTSRDWAAFLRANNLEHSMSRRRNCHDNAVAESFFNLLKRERIRRRTYKTREAARRDIFDYIEMFYNPKRKHVRNGMLSPVDFENRQQNVNQEGVYKSRGYSLHGRCEKPE